MRRPPLFGRVVCGFARRARPSAPVGLLREWGARGLASLLPDFVFDAASGWCMPASSSALAPSDQGPPPLEPSAVTARVGGPGRRGAASGTGAPSRRRLAAGGPARACGSGFDSRWRCLRLLLLDCCLPREPGTVAFARLWCALGLACLLTPFRGRGSASAFALCLVCGHGVGCALRSVSSHLPAHGASLTALGRCASPEGAAPISFVVACASRM